VVHAGLVLGTGGDEPRMREDLQLQAAHLDDGGAEAVGVRPRGAQDGEAERPVEVECPVQVGDPESDVIDGGQSDHGPSSG